MQKVIYRTVCKEVFGARKVEIIRGKKNCTGKEELYGERRIVRGKKNCTRKIEIVRGKKNCTRKEKLYAER